MKNKIHNDRGAILIAVLIVYGVLSMLVMVILSAVSVQQTRLQLDRSISQATLLSESAISWSVWELKREVEDSEATFLPADIDGNIDSQTLGSGTIQATYNSSTKLINGIGTVDGVSIYKTRRYGR